MLLTILSTLIQFNNHLLPVVQDPFLETIAMDRELVLWEDTMTPSPRADIISNLRKKEIVTSLINKKIEESGENLEDVENEQETVNNTRKNKNTDQSGTVAQWFFDTKVDGYSDNRWEGHCTQYAARYRWKHHDTKITWRGNANQRRQNALDDNRPTGDTPKLWSMVITDAQIWIRSEYGHVWVIVKIDEDTGNFLVEDMNYQGEYMVTHRWMSADEPYILGYIYLPE
mgnify:CR=1 FL=1